MKKNNIIIFSLLLLLTIGIVTFNYSNQLVVLFVEGAAPNPGHSLLQIEGSENLATKDYVGTAINNIGIGNYAPTSRTISTGSGLSGGGDLTANRTLTVDSTVVRTTGNQTLAGTKTFSSNVVVPATPTAANHVATKDYVDGKSIPSGMIAMFDASCPTGWTRV